MCSDARSALHLPDKYSSPVHPSTLRIADEVIEIAHPVPFVTAHWNAPNDSSVFSLSV